MAPRVFNHATLRNIYATPPGEYILETLAISTVHGFLGKSSAQHLCNFCATPGIEKLLRAAPPPLGGATCNNIPRNHDGALRKKKAVRRQPRESGGSGHHDQPPPGPSWRVDVLRTFVVKRLI